MNDDQLRELGAQVDDALGSVEDLRHIAGRLGVFRQALIQAGFGNVRSEMMARDYFNEVLDRAREA